MALQQLNQEQMAAVTAPLKPTLVLAGAGTGKTRVLTNRILYLVQQCGVPARQILAITFTNKAANEMKRRLYDFNCDAHYMHISTIHSFCASVLRNEAANLNRNSNFSIYTEEEKRSLVKKIAKQILDESDSKTVDSLCDGISTLKNNLPDCLVPKLAEEECLDAEVEEQLEKIKEISQSSSREQLLQVIDNYNSQMVQSNALDFDDLLYYVYRLFSTSPEVLEKYQERFKFVLIDEFQDTNRVQYQIFKLLGQKYGNIFVVGDDDQSIYSWRGADAYNLKKFSNDFADCNIFKLQQNYRSTKRILEVANNIIEKNLDRFEKTLWTENEQGVAVQMFSAYNEQDESEWVCNHILKLCALGGYSLSDFAVLMRMSALSRSFEQQFQRNRLAYKVYGGFKFFERKEIKDILAYLRLIVNPFDSEAFLRAINVPQKRGLGDTSLAKLRNIAADYCLSLVDTISDERNLEPFNKSIQQKFLTFHNLYTQLRQLSKDLALRDFVHTMLDMLGFRKVYADLGEDDRVLHVDEFEESVNEYCKIAPKSTLAEYLQTVSLLSDTDEEASGDFITVATIHAVKGLEFKVVFVVGLEEGIFPIFRANNFDEDYSQEERRLMYVATTRAEKRLYLSRANSRFMWGERKRTYPSKYYTETQRFLQAERQPATERQLADNKFLDRPTSYAPAPNPGKKSSEVRKFSVGMLVEHKTFGQGMILRINGDVAEIVFEKSGKMALNLKFAPLTIVR